MDLVARRHAVAAAAAPSCSENQVVHSSLLKHCLYNFSQSNFKTGCLSSYRVKACTPPLPRTLHLGGERRIIVCHTAHMHTIYIIVCHTAHMHTTTQVCSSLKALFVSFFTIKL